VTVRDTGFTMASIPVGTVFDPKQFTPERMQEVEAARYTLHQFVSPPIAVSSDGSASAVVRVALTNPCSLPIEITLLAKGDPAWLIAPDHRHAKIEPKQGKVFEFACAREATPSLDNFAAPEFELRFDVLTPDARLAMPAWSMRAATRLLPPAGGWPESKTNNALVLNGTNACLEIDRSQLAGIDGPFTVEAWVLPSRDTNGAIVSNIKIGGFSLEVAGTPQFRVQTDSPEVNERRFTDLKPAIAVKSRERLAPGRWTHLAGVFDGRQIALFVDGKRVASTNAPGARLSSDKSLYIGARPNGAFNTHNFSYPMLYYRGVVDDVRISRAARYERDFIPPVRLARDRSTVFVLANDQPFGPFVPADAESPTQVQALVKGQPRFEPAER
jgi:hypothetical protein